jgi:hypothetical protein
MQSPGQSVITSDNGDGTVTRCLYRFGKLVEKRIVNTTPCAPSIHRTVVDLAMHDHTVTTCTVGLDRFDR